MSKLNLHIQWWLIVVILIFSTVAFGGIGLQANYVIRILILISFLFQLAVFCLEDNYFKDFYPAIWLPISLYLAFIILVYFQYFFGLKILKDSVIGSINPYFTYDSIIQLVIYLMFFVACLKIASKHEFVERLMSLIVVLTFVIAILGMAQRLSDHRILWKSITSIDRRQTKIENVRPTN